MMLDKWDKHEFPLHILTWYDKYEILEKCLSNNTTDECEKEYDIEKKDLRGRSALHLAVILGNISSVQVLLKYGADVTSQNSHCWTVLQEAVSTGKPDLVHMCLEHYKRGGSQGKKKLDVPALLEKLRQTPDFYVEMKWEFTSWVPLMSRMCPNDTYKIWKRGSNVRVDTTLLGFEDNSASVVELDHDLNQVHIKNFDVMSAEGLTTSLHRVGDVAVSKRLEMPIANTYLNTEKISFARDKCGMWGFRQDKNESVNNYEAKVFNAMNVELITRTRTEHLSEQDKKRLEKIKEESSAGKRTLETILGVAEKEEKLFTLLKPDKTQCTTKGGVTGGLTIEEYFNANVVLDSKRNIGHPIEQVTKTRSFSAHVWLAETYPLSLQEQLLPVIQLMARSNAHFKRLHDFIVLQLPAGFPIKIEIPLFHVLNARITFGNIFALDAPVLGVLSTTQTTTTTTTKDEVVVTKNACQSPAIRRRNNKPNEMKPPVNVVLKESEEESKPTSPPKVKRRCIMEESLFDIPNTYSVIGDSEESDTNFMNVAYDEDEEMLQFAMQQSLLESGETQITYQMPNEDRMLQRAIQESLSNQDTSETCSQPNTYEQMGQEDRMADILAESRRQLAEDERMRQAREDEILENILKLSMTEK